MSAESALKSRFAAFFSRLVLFVSLAAMVLTSAALIFIEYRRGMDQIEEHLGIVRDSHAPAIANALRFGDRDSIEILLQGIVHLPHFRFAEMRGANGLVIAAGERAAAPPIVRTFPLNAIHAGPGAAGDLTITADQDRVLARVGKIASVMIPLNALSVLLIAGLVHRLTEKRITRPLAALVRYARDFKIDDLFVPLRLPIRRDGAPDEFDDIETAVNAMGLRLRAIHQEDKSRAADLDIEIRARTWQLEAKERDLRDAEVFANRAVEYLADALIVIDAHGIIRRVNPAAERMFGHAAADMIGINVNILMPEPHHSAHDSYLAHYRRTGQTSIIGQGRRLTARRRDGSLFPVDLTVAEIMGDEERLFIGTLRDLSEREKTERMLSVAARTAETASRSKSDFLAIMNHELRTPLNAVLGYADLIRMQTFGPVGDPRYAEYLDIIHASGSHLLDLINNILDVSAIEANALTLREESLDPQELCRDVLRLIRARADKGSVQVENRCPGGLPVFVADQRRMRQILLNLLFNAVKFTPQGGTAAIAARLGPDRAMIFEIADTGIGMSEADIARVLHPFGQIDSGLDRTHDGIGLGLPLSKGLVEMHGGTLAIDSAPGRGTTVTVRLPPERTRPAIAPEARPS